VRRLITAAFVLAVCAAAFVLAGAAEDDATGKRYKIEFDNAFGLVEGGDLKIGKVRAGQTTGFEVSKDQPRRAIVEIEVSEPGFDDFRVDASCSIEPQSLIGEYFVNCQTGSAKQKLPAGGTVPAEQTQSTIPADLVNNIMRRPYRERLRLILTELGTALAGNPQRLAEVLRRAHPGLRETNKVLRILARQNRIIQNFITDSDTVIAALEANKQDVARFVVEAGETAEISATRREDIARSFRRLPTFLDELRPYMVRLGQLADEQTPLLIDLQRAAPHLEETFRRLGPFADASRPAFRSLGRTAVVGRRAINESQEEIAELREVAKNAPGVGRPLRRFLVSIDSRNRDIENDARATATDPPAPDPTHISGNGGFTGMEAVWNYFFWQTLALNSGDKFGRVLKLVVLEDPPCGEYHNNAENMEARCRQWLGPDQPGITTGDPTAGGEIRSRARAADRGDPRARAAAREHGITPESPARPGQRDLSRPQIALPPELEKIVDGLTGRSRSERPRRPQSPGGAPAPNQLLDFLLAP
jgi:ABC-type transporter Mla subunit MlaD